MKKYIQRDISSNGSGGYSGAAMASESQRSEYMDSKNLLVNLMMKKYGIDEDDLHQISKVKSKLRDLNIDEVLS